MDKSDLIALVALAISSAAAVGAGITLWLSFRESKRRDEEIRLLKQETGRRELELLLIRKQAEQDREERELPKRASLTLIEDQSHGSPNGIRYEFRVNNAGPHHVSNLIIRLIDPHKRVVGETHHPELILPGATSVPVIIDTPSSDGYSGPYDVQLSWQDGRGWMTQDTQLTVGKP